MLRTWQLDPDLVDRIRRLLDQVPLTIPIPQPDPVPDFSMFERLVAGTNDTLPAVSETAAEIAEGNFPSGAGTGQAPPESARIGGPARMALLADL